MISFILNVAETKPGTCAADMQINVGKDATSMEHEMAKALDCGIRQTLLLVSKTANSGQIIEGREIEQFVQAALERAKR